MKINFRSELSVGGSVKRRLTMIIAILFFCTALIAGTGCKSDRDDRITLHIGINGDPRSLDPRTATDAASSRVNQLIYNSLIKKDIHSDLVPDLAESWSMPDDSTYVFKLKQGVKFHDGSDLTAEDVAFTFNSLLDPEFRSPKRAAYEKLESINVKDPYTIVFHLKEPFAPFLINMVLGIVPKPEGEEGLRDLNENPVGTGPFRFVSRRSGEEIVLERFTDYFSPFEEPGRLERLVYRIIPDDTIRILELEKGSIDFVQNNIPRDIVGRMREKDEFEVSVKPGTNFYYMGFNMQDDILKSEKVRQAICHAVDRDSIIENLLYGFATPAGSLLPEGHWAYEPETIEYGHDPEKAEQLLEEAGYELKQLEGADEPARFKLLYKTSQNKLSRQIAEVFQANLKQVGIHVDIRSYEWGTFYDDIIKGNFQLYSLSWVGITDPDIYYSIFHSSSVPPNGRNRGRYSNPELDELLEQGRLTLDQDKRARIYSKVQKILSEEVPYCCLWHEDNIVIMEEDFRGYRIYPAGDFDSLSQVVYRPS